jgi:hypothetical protein
VNTYTYVVLEVSQSTYNEIATSLRKAGWSHVFRTSDEPGQELIDMRGLALGVEAPRLAGQPQVQVQWDARRNQPE